MDNDSKTAIPTRDFTDAGTGRSFAKGVRPDPYFTPGEYDNFFHAGLIAEPAADTTPAPASEAAA